MFVFVTDQKRCPRKMGFNQKQMESEILINTGLVKMLDDETKYLAHSLKFFCVIGKGLHKKAILLS